ncbi:MAG: efflux RND transporter permease subunit [Pseudomonadota bacterium]
MIAWFAKNDVVANLLLLAIVVCGVLSFQRIPLEVFPSFSRDVVTVQTALRGSSPEDVERGVTIPIEESVQDINGIKKITSRTSEGLSVVRFDIDSAYDADEVLNEIKSRVDALNDLPVDARKSVIERTVAMREVITVSLSGEVSERLLRAQVDIVRDELLQLPDVSRVTLSGVRDYEMSIEVDQSQLERYGLTIEALARKINESSTDVSAGKIMGAAGEVFIRSRHQAYSRTDFEHIVITSTPEGGVVTLKDVANIHDGFEQDQRLTRFNKKPAALLEVYRVGDESAIDVANAVKQYIGEKNNTLPGALTLNFWNDQSRVIKARISTLLYNALQGGILVLLLLGLFLRPAVATWVFVGIPVSFTGAFVVMYLMGTTFNLISLFGFILVLGIVVDDAIVTGENIYSHIRSGSNGLSAAIEGTQEIAAPVLFGILTTVVAFAPLFFIDGARGAIFAQIPAVVIPVLLFSLLESKFILPAHLKHLKPLSTGNASRLTRLQSSVASGMEYMAQRVYPRILVSVLRHRVLALACFIGVFMLVVAAIQSGKIRFMFFPKISSERISMNLTMPVGTSFTVTDRAVERASQAVYELKDEYLKTYNEDIILNVMSLSGSNGNGNKGRVFFEVSSPEGRRTQLESPEIVAAWREKIGTISGAESVTFRAEIGRSGDPIDVELRSNNIDSMVALGEQLKRKVSSMEGVFDVVDSNGSARDEYLIELKPQAIALGLTQTAIAQKVRYAFYGFEVQRFQRGRDDVAVFVRAPLTQRSQLNQLKALLINTPSGDALPLSQLATLVPSRGLNTINRVDRYRVFSVRADVDKTRVDMLAINQSIREFLERELGNYPGVYYRFEGESREQKEVFASLFVGLLVVLFAIYTLLAIPFRSYVLPFVVMLVIPFGFIGAVLGHMIMGMNLSIMSVMGMLALVGIVVNDSLVLVDFINKQARENNETQMQLFERVAQAGRFRFRAVVLTSMTTFIGLMPLLFEQSTQAQFLIPMAISLGFGIVFATLITLLLVPMNYVFLNDVSRLKQEVLQRIAPVRD